MKSQLPIIEALKRHVERKATSWHVPGHKNGSLVLGLPDFFEWDKTELAGLDDFHHPTEAILEAKALLREIYDSEDSHFLINGSTSGNWAMLAAVTKRGDRVYVQRNSHKSIFNALEWLGLSPIFMSPEYDEETQIAGNVSRETLKEALTSYPGGVAVFLTSPSYYGETAAIEEIVAVTARYKIPLLVDEAHGAHFGEAVGIRSAFEQGATAVVQSAHKTLPALTMGAWIHERLTDLQRRKLHHALQSFQTSSPSYLIMASLDYARYYRQQWTIDEMEEVRNSHQLFKDELDGLEGMHAFTFDDWSRVILSYEDYSGEQLLDALANEKIDAEFALASFVVCILPLHKLSETVRTQWLRQVKDAIEKLKMKGIPSKRYIEQSIMGKIKVSSLACPLDQLEEREYRNLPLRETIGQIALETIIPYPPGIPVLLRGERVTKEQIVCIEHHIAASVHLQGGESLQEGTLRVIEEGFVE
ncbi:aminotransferase class I/II-fold pyridoxal phosphate-dependent enzyme [Exiguobacterium oxidotolerans]|uniref:Arginine decarboxylase n=1 Tax=Exiguobacterium oxidotolerans TaxID=223958 RepID=A0A653I545_9BACL|nr:aminotransferase class I/II-fold pyridoxal phosphate-dependent enzyme [Exiguobacterium oxidotolerans]VWX33902.1 Arginine decarboxylase [Exiguobacterium oxidotolerans]